MKLFYYFIILLFLSLTFQNFEDFQSLQIQTLQAKTYTIPKNALKLLNSLPEKSLTLDLILKRGLTTDSFEIIKLQNLEEKILNNAAQIPFDTYLSTSVIQGNDKSRPTQPGVPYSNRFLQGQLKLSRNFSTGTLISLESNYSDRSLPSRAFSIIGDDIYSKYYENKIHLNIRQNLLKDSFGYASRKQLKAINTQKKNVKNKFAVNTENWAYALIQNFYTAWLLQSQVHVAKANYNRQKKLRKITNLKFKRGTSVKSDLLQVKSAEKNSKHNLDNAIQELGNIWHNLVIQLNFPQDWLDINPLLVPMKLDQPIAKAKLSCKKDLDLKSNWQVKSLTEQYKADQLKLSAAKNQMLPEVYLGLKLSSNAVSNNDKLQAFTDSLQNKNQGLFVELGVSIPLGNYEGKSKLAQEYMNKNISQRRLSSLKKTLTVDWKNECLNLLRLIKKKKQLKWVKFMQKQRATLEKKRFRIGKVPVFNNIQAGLDSALADIAFKQSKVHLRLSAWKILTMNSQLITYITKLSGIQKPKGGKK